MNTKEIEQFVRSDKICRDIFQGVFSIDTLPDKPRLLVCNTDPSHKPGEHWIAIFVDSRRHGEYFDSFGRKPSGVLENYMNVNCIDWIYNARQLQSIVSSRCGQYCIFYCMFRCRGFDLTSIVSLFTRDTGFNDSIVRGFVRNDGISFENSRFPPIQFLRTQHETKSQTQSGSYAERLVDAHQPRRRDMHATRHRLQKRQPTRGRRIDAARTRGPRQSRSDV